MKRINSIQLTSDEWHKLLGSITENGKLLGISDWHCFLESPDFTLHIYEVVENISSYREIKERLLKILNIDDIIDILIDYEMDRISIIHEMEEINDDL